MSCCLEGRAENEAGPDLQVKKERTMGEGGVIGKDQELLSLHRWVLLLAPNSLISPPRGHCTTRSPPNRNIHYFYIKINN